MSTKKKPVLLDTDVHSKLMQFKAREKLKNANNAIKQLLDNSDWEA